MKALDGKKVLVTGGSSGIGLATARAVAEHGGKVVLIARDEAKLTDALATVPGTGHASFSADVSEESQLKDALAASVSDSGPFDGLVHCAGMHQVRPVAAVKSAQLDELMSVNVCSAMLIVKSLLRRVSKDGASFVLVSSTSGIRGTAGVSAYSASKGAIVALGRSLAVELAPRSIRVNTLVPGLVETPMSDAFLAALPTPQRDAVVDSHLLGTGLPEDVAGPAVFLLSPAARWMTGSELVVDGGLTCK